MIFLFRIALAFIGRAPLRSLLAALGVAAGVSVVIALEEVDQGLEGAFGDTKVSAPHDLDVEGGASGVSSELLDALLDRPDVVSRAAARIEQPLTIHGRDGARRAHLVGVDFLSEGESAGLEGGGDPLETIGDPNVAFVSAALAEREGLRTGDTLRVTGARGIVPLRVLGVLPASRTGQEVVVASVDAAAHLLGRDGRFDRIEVTLVRDASRSQVEAVVAGRAEVLAAGEHDRRLAQTTAALRDALRLESVLALAVTVLLVHLATAMALSLRRRPIAVLRATGASRMQIAAVFAAEALFIGIVGTAFGIVVGHAVGAGVLAVLGPDLARVHGGATPIAALTPRIIATASGAAFLAVIIGATTPIRHAMNDGLPAMLRGAPEHRSSRRFARGLALAGATIAAGGIALASRNGTLAVLAVFIGCAAIAPWVTGVLVVVARRIARSSSLLFTVALDQAIAGGRRVSLSATALAAAVSMCLAVSVYTRSYEHTIEEWAEGAVPADVLVTSGSPLLDRGASPFALDEHTLAEVRGAPGVGRAFDVRAAQIRASGLVTDVLCVDSHAYLSGRARRGALRILAGRESIARDGLLSMDDVVPVAVSETFARQSGRGAGDELAIGPVTVRIVAVIADYSTTRGWMVVDERDGERLLGKVLPSALALEADDPARAHDVAEAVRHALGASAEGLFVSTRQEVHEEILRVARRSLAIARAGQWAVLVIALLAMICASVGSALDRRDDHALLRTLGASSRQVAIVAVIEAAMLAFAATVLGIAASLPLARVFLDGAGLDATGWHVPLVVPAASVALTSLFVITLASASAFPIGLASARRPLLRALPF